MTALLPSPAPLVVRRRLRPRLWTGRADGHHLGTIEHGRRFTVTGLDGETRNGYRTLEAAQSALTGDLPVSAPAAASEPAPIPLALIAAATAAMLVSVAFSTAGLALLP